MSFPWFSKTRTARSKSTGNRRRSALPLCLESLEERTVPTVQPLSSGTVAGLYFDVLGREASQGEINGWSQTIAQGASPTQVAQSFVGSSENFQKQAQNLYQTLFNAAPSAATLASMTSQLQASGGNLLLLQYQEITTPSYFSTVAKSSNSTWLTDLYQTVLGRPADNQGFGYWATQLAMNASRQGVAANFVFSTEALQNAVSNAYHQILGRNADTGGISFWSTSMKNGMTFDQLEIQLAASPEYAGQFANAALPTSTQTDTIDSRVTSASMQASDYYTTATPSIPFVSNVAGVSGRAYIQIDFNNDGQFTGNELFGSSGILSPTSTSITLQPLAQGTYNIRGLIKTVTGGQITTPVTTITIDPAGDQIGSQLILQLMNDYQRNMKQTGTLPANFAKNHPLVRINAQQQVQVDIHSTLPQYLSTLETSLQSQGMVVEGVYANQDMIQGYYPISALSTIVTTPHFRDIVPIVPSIQSTGSAESQGDAVILGPTFRSTTGDTGLGLKIGVLSDTVNLVGGGIADSQKTGDLPASGVQVLEDGNPQGATDEGRAMLEIVNDVAPGASLAFHTGAISPQDMATGITDLAAAGANVITDDESWADDPMFNDGLISQAVDQVHSQGVFYDSSAGNFGDQGFISSWTSTTATVGGQNGTFLKMADGTALEKFSLQPGDSITPNVQWDNAFLEGGAPNQPNYQVKTEIDVFVTSADGSQLFGEFNTNTLNTNEAFQIGNFINSGSLGTNNFALAFELAQGPAPTTLRWMNFSESTQTLVLASGGGPTIYGHAMATGGVAVAATEWFSNQIDGNTNYVTENFSSLGGALPKIFDNTGARLPTPQILNEPIITAPDGVATSFFGQPALPNDPDASDGFPRFYGTSAAAPHLAAAAALEMQQSGGTNVQVLQNMVQTALDIDAPGSDAGSGAGVVQLHPFTPSGGGGGGGGGGGTTGDDRFESNETSDRATNLGVLASGTQSQAGLTIINHANGLPDYDWYRYTAGSTGTLTVSIKYQSAGDLDLRVFTVDANNTLIPLGSGLSSGQSQQTVTAAIGGGMPILIWVFGFDFAQGSYDLNVSLS